MDAVDTKVLSDWEKKNEHTLLYEKQKSAFNLWLRRIFGLINYINFEHCHNLYNNYSQTRFKIELLMRIKYISKDYKIYIKLLINSKKLLFINILILFLITFCKYYDHSRL